MVSIIKSKTAINRVFRMKSKQDKDRIREEKKKMTQIMFSLFMDIWHKRKHVSEISGKWLGKEALSVFFHHILPKSKYQNATFDEENIILLTFDEHTMVENNPQKYEEINKRRIKLLEKYGNNRSSEERLLE